MFGVGDGVGKNSSSLLGLRLMKRISMALIWNGAKDLGTRVLVVRSL